jgi:RecA/RadA recombinase
MKLSQLIKSVRKDLNTTSAAQTDITKIKEWYDTGSYSLNRVISGDIYKGVPSGRIFQIFGDSQSGKSLIACQTAALALKNGQIDTIFFVDSEGGGTQILEGLGVDMEKVEYIPVSSIEECSVQMLKLYDTFMKARQEYVENPDSNDDIRAIVILDSWGGLSADKLVEDAVKKDKQVQDMGLGAKLKNNLISGLMMRVVRSGVSLFILNHTYENPGAVFVSKIKPIPGGKKIEFASHIILQSTKLLIKADNKEFLTGTEDEGSEAGFYKGNRLNFFCVKNRVAKPCFSADVYVDFDAGISVYDGLIDDAIKMGFIKKVHGGYSVKSYKDGVKVTYKKLISSPEIWDTFIDEFNKQSIESMKFSKTIVEMITEEEEKLGLKNGGQDKMADIEEVEVE